MPTYAGDRGGLRGYAGDWHPAHVWIQYGTQGWVRVNGLEVVAFAHTTLDEGRRILDTLIIDANPWAPGVTSAVLRAFPTARLEAMVNTPESLRLLAERDDRDPKKDPIHSAIHDLDSKDFYPIDTPYALEEVPRLARPDGTDPDGFYRQVAEAYNAALRDSMKPAAVLAELAGVPVPTVHRWILEARRRGFLPPARKGRAG